jgi:Tfp pilus assembly protein PilN
MITPNLATRPFLNTRPVWLVTAVAGLAAIVLLGLDLRLILVENRALDAETAKRDALFRQVEALATEVRVDVDALEKVPWRSLTRRVNATNLILREHAFSWIGMLNDIERVMPYNVRLTRIGPAVGPDEVTLSLALIALNRDSMLEMLDNLIADPHFSDPTPTVESTPEESTTAGYLLTLRVNYHPILEGS